MESQAKMWELGQTILCDVSWCKYLVCYNSYNFTSFQLVYQKKPVECIAQNYVSLRERHSKHYVGEGKKTILQ